MTKTVTLCEELVQDLETYRRKLEAKTGHSVTFTKAFHQLMELSLRMLDDEINKQDEKNEKPRVMGANPRGVSLIDRPQPMESVGPYRHSTTGQ